MAVPLRMCVVTRERKPKEQLIRLVKSGNKIFIDNKQIMPGRGVWFRKDVDLNRLKKSKALNRAFKCEVPEDIYYVLEKICSQN